MIKLSRMTLNKFLCYCSWTDIILGTECEPDLICQLVAIVLTTFQQNCHICWNSLRKLDVAKNTKQPYFLLLSVLGFSFGESSAGSNNEVSQQSQRYHLFKGDDPKANTYLSKQKNRSTQKKMHIHTHIYTDCVSVYISSKFL